MRNASLAVLREIGVDTGGSNVQFAINPKDGRMVIIEMNPSVSRSSALSAKAPGFADTTLGTQMKSVGEVMAIGRTFKEALGKGIRSLETGKKFGSEVFDKTLVP